ncbi:MAG: hypothetical protein HWN70_08975, partial [Desulfobacterales bacterium]|nr:hypothetical protein [Desulfobacterales bacterium]
MAKLDHKVLLDTIKNRIEEKAYPELETLITEPHPADLADLIEHLESDERLSVFKLLTSERAGEVLIEISSPIQESLTNGLDDQTIAHILNELNSDDATDIVNYLPRERAQKIIGLVEPDVSEELQKL